VNNKKIVIKFSRSLYPLKPIKEAIKQFQHLARFTLQEEEHWIIVTLSKVNPDFRETIDDEFSNYVLAEIKGISS